MSLVVANDALKAFSVATTALAFKMFITLTIQGGKSFDAGVRPPEDNQFNKAGAPTQNYGLTNGDTDQQQPSLELMKAREVDFRWKRIVQNDLENIPIGLAVLLGSVLAGGHETTNVVLISAFAAARIAHTVAYANQLQPHRAICWTLGQLCVLAAGLNGVISFIIGGRKADAAAAARARAVELHKAKESTDEETDETQALQRHARRRGKPARDSHY